METIKSYFSEENKGKTITTILVVILVVLAGYFFFGKPAFAPSQKDLKADTTATTTTSTLINSIGVSNQAPSDSIIIDKAVLNQPSWIAIYSDNEGEPDSIIGAQYLKAGKYTDIPVQIFVRTVAGQTYYAVITSDDGTISFDYKKDLPIINPEGKWIMDSFEVSPIGSRG